MVLTARRAAPPPPEALGRQGFLKKAGEIYDQTVGQVGPQATFTEYEAAAVQASRELGLLVLQQQLAHRVERGSKDEGEACCPNPHFSPIRREKWSPERQTY